MASSASSYQCNGPVCYFDLWPLTFYSLTHIMFSFKLPQTQNAGAQTAERCRRYQTRYTCTFLTTSSAVLWEDSTMTPLWGAICAASPPYADFSVRQPLPGSFNSCPSTVSIQLTSLGCPIFAASCWRAIALLGSWLSMSRNANYSAGNLWAMMTGHTQNLWQCTPKPWYTCPT